MKWHIFFFALGLLSCQSQAETDQRDISAPPSAEAVIEGVRFSDILDEYRALNIRLESIAYPILSANVSLCPKIRRDVGFTVHTVDDYPVTLRAVARDLLPVGDELSLRTVRKGSPADNAGLRSGDRLIGIGQSFIPSGTQTGTLWDGILNRALEADVTPVIIERDGHRIRAELRPETLCDYPVTVFFSERVNGHTDGEKVLITSALMRTVPEDVNLALIVAHEMSHAIAGHISQTPSKALELEADRMALVMMARAGYDINYAISYWKAAPHPNRGYQASSSTHPSILDRLTNFEISERHIRRKQAQGQELLFWD